jgi:4-hydroxy-3-polyprenylbenzoate decarboxylase
MVRETPFHKGHLRLMLQMADMGALIAPAIPSFYKKPKTIDDIVNQTVGRILDYMGVAVDLFQRWSEADGRHALEMLRREG